MTPQPKPLYADNDGPLFADASFRESAWRALREVYGPPERWAKETRYIARRFLKAASSLTPATLSLKALKTTLGGIVCHDHLHRVAFRFLGLCKDSYAAPDRDAFLEILPDLSAKDKAHKIILGNDFDSFDDISCYRYCGKTTFVAIHTRNDEMKPVYRRFIRHASWSSYDKPNQDRFDRLFSVLDTFIPRRNPPAALSIRTFHTSLPQGLSRHL